ncbi:MAG: CDP-glycerol glycerophosphotransferase family protein [Oscillospiraceae bacterium]|nr:CDP-glycerol glycerophosphotransferase family protein [Oscillospiraceae bacterium]
MKTTIFCVIIRVGTWVLQALYGLMKLAPVHNRVCFFSRQGDEPSIDFQMLMEELRATAPDMEQVVLCHQFRTGRDRFLSFAMDQLRSMRLLATSRACIVDGYWPVVSLLRHRKDLTVVQIWHSVGKIKKSGYQTLDTPSGRNGKLARALKMHRNYTYIISGGTAWTPYYLASFDTTPEHLRHFGLPRLDWLLEQGDLRPAFEEKYPELKGKTIVLYAPTYRTYDINPQNELLPLFDGDKYALVCRFHPNQKFAAPLPEQVTRYEDGDTFEWMSCCDIVITDYSSLSLEAAVLNKRIYYFLFDHDQYLRDNGLNVDPAEIMPRCSFEKAEDLFAAIDSGDYPDDELQSFRRGYLPEELGSSTRNIAALITGVNVKEKELETV